MPLTVHEAIAVQRVAHMLRGGHDLTDADVREAIARDLHQLETKANKRLGAGPVDPTDKWARRLADWADSEDE